MKKLLLLTFAVILAACGKADPPPTVEALASNPEKLKELREQCRIDRAKLGDELCNRVAEATNRRFFNNGKPTPYTPSKEQPKF
jgi:hypothetical protein